MTHTANKEQIVKGFSNAAESYDAAAILQKRAAALLATRLPNNLAIKGETVRILEIGCGTGLLTAHLRSKAPANAELIITDISLSMIEENNKRHGEDPRIIYAHLDGESIETASFLGKFNLIACSMAAQWFKNPAETINQWQNHLLKPNGHIAYIVPAKGAFKEWHTACAHNNVKSGMMQGCEDMPNAKILHTAVEYGNARNFLKSMKDVGAGTPAQDYKPLSAGELRAVCKTFDEQNPNGKVSWPLALGIVPR